MCQALEYPAELSALKSGDLNAFAVQEQLSLVARQRQTDQAFGRREPGGVQPERQEQARVMAHSSPVFPLLLEI
jgi:hypothetical protein